MSVVAAGIGAAVSIGGGIFGASKARKEARRKARQARALERKLKQLEDNRQEIINPYASVTDLSNMLSNPFANLSVATQATEIKMEQTDQALANTLDTLRATGASAGGATALAQAALQAKKGIAADIERQEVSNNNKEQLENKDFKASKWLKHKEYNKLVYKEIYSSFNKERLEKQLNLIE